MCWPPRCSAAPALRGASARYRGSCSALFSWRSCRTVSTSSACRATSSRSLSAWRSCFRPASPDFRAAPAGGTVPPRRRRRRLAEELGPASGLAGIDRLLHRLRERGPRDILGLGGLLIALLVLF